jgi:hypothetical protein
MRRLWWWSLPLVLAGCQTWGPTWSEVTGNKWTQTVAYRRPAIIERIDNESPLSGSFIRIEPGRHELTLRGTDPRWVDGGGRNNLAIDALPCKRYYINAQYENSIGADWKPVVDYVWDIAGCKS